MFSKMSNTSPRVRSSRSRRYARTGAHETPPGACGRRRRGYFLGGGPRTARCGLLGVVRVDFDVERGDTRPRRTFPRASARNSSPLDLTTHALDDDMLLRALLQAVALVALALVALAPASCNAQATRAVRPPRTPALPLSPPTSPPLARFPPEGHASDEGLDVTPAPSRAISFSQTTTAAAKNYGYGSGYKYKDPKHEYGHNNGGYKYKDPKHSVRPQPKATAYKDYCKYKDPKHEYGHNNGGYKYKDPKHEYGRDNGGYKYKDPEARVRPASTTTTTSRVQLRSTSTRTPSRRVRPHASARRTAAYKRDAGVQGPQARAPPGTGPSTSRQRRSGAFLPAAALVALALVALAPASCDAQIYKYKDPNKHESRPQKRRLQVQGPQARPRLRLQVQGPQARVRPQKRQQVWRVATSTRTPQSTWSPTPPSSLAWISQRTRAWITAGMAHEACLLGPERSGRLSGLPGFATTNAAQMGGK